MKTHNIRLTLWVWLLKIHLHAFAFTEPSLSRSDDAVILHNGRPDMRQLFRVIESLDESEAFNEDLELPDDLEDETVNITSKERRTRFVHDNDKRKWTHGIIPYTFDSNLEDSKRTNIKEVFSLIEYWTYFRFLPWNESLPDICGLPHRNYLIFKPGGSCWSYVGNHMYKGGQPIACCTGTACLHEIGHAIGFHHEHANPLRDQYIRVNYENVVDRLVPFFGVRQASSIDRAFGYYDMSSVMAYPSWAFSKNKRAVITVYDPEMDFMINRKDSTGYYLFYEAQIIYHMKDQMCPNVTIVCQHGGYLSYINGSCRCRCPQGLDHTTGCTSLLPAAGAIDTFDTCGEVIHLSEDTPSANIVTPGFPDVFTGQHNCTWFIKGPENTTLSLVFSEFEIGNERTGKCEGHLEIRHLLPGQPGVPYCGRGFQKTVVSEVNVISLLLVRTTSAKFSATLRLVKDLCYTDGGKDNSYVGTLNYTEEFRPCLPWDQVTSCRMNTFNVDHMDLVENYCRNPGYGTRPWCYVDADTCTRGYCDVCQLKKCYDLFDDCATLIRSDGEFCVKGIDASRGCRRTCGLCHNATITRFVKHCGLPPSVPDSDTVVDETKDYRVGDIVTYRCRTNTNITANSTCTSNGSWTFVAYVCQDGTICADQRPDCISLLERNPTLCVRWRGFAVRRCAKTCAICNYRTRTVCRSSGMSYNTVALSPRYTKQGSISMVFCKFGYQLSSGNTYRTCKPDGTLTGQPPRCVGRNDITAESYHVTLRRRRRTGRANQALVIKNSYYKIKRSGEITGWKFYSNYAGRVVFQVWTYFSKTDRYKLVGQNVINDTKSDRLVQVDVPVSERINVYYGQLIGIYYHHKNPGGIPYDDCVTTYDPQGANIVELNIDGGIPILDTLYTVRKPLPCGLYSFSAIIGPRTVEPKAKSNSIFDHIYNSMQRFRTFHFWG